MTFFCEKCRKAASEIEVDCEDWEEDNEVYVTVFCHGSLQKFAVSNECTQYLVSAFGESCERLN